MRDIIGIIVDAILVATFQRDGYCRPERCPRGDGSKRDGHDRRPPVGRC
jgi:hypothetical protein